MRASLFSGRLAACKRGARRWRSDERGVTALEFGLLSAPFLGIVFAIVEMSILFFANQLLDTAVQDASRQMMVGGVQSLTAATFKKDVCNRMPGLIACSAGLHVDVRSYPSAAPAPMLPVNSGAFDPSGFTFDPGGPNCIVVIRAALEYPVYTALLGNGLKTLDNGKRVMMSTVSYRNEPFTGGAAPAC